MTTEPELDKLIIDNLADLDAAAKRADVLVQEIWNEVTTLLETWAKDHGWLKPEDPDDPSVAPPDWVDGDNYLAWFQVDWGPGDTHEGKEGQAYFGLSRFAGVGGGRLCLWLVFNGVKRSAWKPLLREAASQGNAGGFSFDDAEGSTSIAHRLLGRYQRPRQTTIMRRRLNPSTRALDAAHAAWPLFNALLKKARA